MEERKEDQAEFSYGRLTGKLTGTTVICAVMIAIFGIAALALIRDGNAQAEARIIYHEQKAEDFREGINTKQDKVIEATNRMTDVMLAMIYVISLPQDKREKLNLAEPPQLKAMLRNRRDE